MRWALRLLVVSLGAVHAWIAAGQQSMNPDGVAYLEMGEAYFRGDWSMAVNTTWPPLYAWILGGATTLLRPGPEWEFTLVHAVDFGIFLFTLACFESFWSGLGAERRRGTESSGACSTWPEWAWTAMGYALFLWCAITLVEPWAVTPDMLLMGLILLIAGRLVRIRSAPTRRTFLGLGLLLGLGYLAKSVMFPLAFVFLAGAGIAAGRFRAAPRVGIALLGFLLVAGPYVAMLSVSKGRPTFGDAGRVTYLRYVDGVVYPHWREGFGAAQGTPIHPSRRIFTEPAAFEFATPIGGSYPISYDPSYWYEGLSPRIEPRMQLARLLESLRFYADFLTGTQGALAAVVALLLALGSTERRSRARGRAGVVLVAIALAALGMYAIVYVEGRYVAPFLLLLWGGLLSLVRLPATAWAGRVLARSAAVVLAFLAVSLAAFHLDGFVRVTGLTPPSDVATRPEAPYLRPAAMAAELSRMGLRQGDGIAYAGTGFDAFFAHLARLRIIAEVPDTEIEELWRMSPERRAELVRALRATGARAIVSEQTPPPDVVREGWERIGNSRHYLFRLR